MTKKKKEVDVEKLKVTKDKPRVFLESHQWCRARFIDADQKEGKWGPYLILNFDLLSGLLEDGKTSVKGKELKLNALVDGALSPSSKLYEYVTIFNGGDEPDIGDEFDLTAFYGNRYEIFVELIADKKDKSIKRTRITKIRNIKKNKSTKKKKR